VAGVYEGVESIELTGAFATGSVFKMTVPGAPDAFTSRLLARFRVMDPPDFV